MAIDPMTALALIQAGATTYQTIAPLFQDNSPDLSSYDKILGRLEGTAFRRANRAASEIDSRVRSDFASRGVSGPLKSGVSAASQRNIYEQVLDQLNASETNILRDVADAETYAKRVDQNEKAAVPGNIAALIGEGASTLANPRVSDSAGTRGVRDLLGLDNAPTIQDILSEARNPELNKPSTDKKPSAPAAPTAPKVENAPAAPSAQSGATTTKQTGLPTVNENGMYSVPDTNITFSKDSDLGGLLETNPDMIMGLAETMPGGWRELLEIFL